MAVDPNTPQTTKSWLRQYANTVSQPAGIGVAGNGVGATPAQVAQAGDAAASVGAATGLVPAPSPAATSLAGVTGSAVTTPSLRALAPGVSRYALPAGEEARVYATRGKDGSSVFTDDPAYAARVSSGKGLGYSNQFATSDPNAGSEFATSRLGAQGLRQQDFSALNPAQTQDALERAITAPGDADTRLSNTQDANLLRARLQPNTVAPGYAAPIAGGSVGPNGIIPAGAGNSVTNLKPADQIALLRAQGALAQGQERVNNSRQSLALQQDSLRRQQGADDRAATSATLDNYAKLQQTDPGSATRYLVNQIPQDAAGFAKFKDTPNGRQVLDTYFNDVVRPGAQNTQRALGNLVPGLNRADNKFAATGPFDWSYLSTDKNGRFAGFRTQGEDQDSTEYPAYGSITGSQNYDQSLYNLSPAVLKMLREDAVNQRK